MKPFALVAAVEEGADPATTYYNSQPLHIYLGPTAVPPFWNVATFWNTYAGSVNLVQATWQSDNTVYAQLALDLGRQDRHRGPRDGHHEPPDPLALDRAGHRGRQPARGRRRLRHPGREGIHHTPQAIARVVFPDGR